MSPMTIPNPANLPLSYQKSVDAGLVDKSYQKLMDKKIEVNADRIGWCPDLEWNQYARAEMIRGIGPKMQEALGPMTVGQFATTRGGMGFAALEPVIGKEGVSRLRNLQKALQACFNGAEPEPQPEPQPTLERFMKLATDFNGYDVSEMVGPTLVELLNTGVGGNHAEVVEQYGSLIAFELLGASLKAYEHGVSPDDLAYMVQNAYHGALGPLSDDDKMRVGTRAEALMNEHASYLPESLQRALGLESEPQRTQMTAEEFMGEFANNFNGRDLDDLESIETMSRDLRNPQTPPETRDQLLGDVASLISFITLFGAIGAHGRGMAAAEVAEEAGQKLEAVMAYASTPAEKNLVKGELAKIADVYMGYLPEVMASALNDVWPA